MIERQHYNAPMNTKIAAACMAELGHERRLAIYKLLVKAGPTGLSVGEIGKKLKIPGSTLSHHLRRLNSVKLIHQKQEKQTIYCHATYQQLNALMAFLTKSCCQDSPCK